MLASRFVLGQRWLSQTEPELGLGLALKLETDRITIVFPSSDTTRVYTIENPPLTRVIFTTGDVLKTQDGKPFVVESVTEKDGRVIYHTKGKKIDESELSDSLTFSKPIDRLMNAQVDDKSLYNLRHRALYRRFKTLRAPLRGFLCGRFTPRHHQMATVVQACRLPAPRVLLADEPGMGKLITAALIMQRQATFGNAGRVLFVAPEASLDLAEKELSRRFGFDFTRAAAEAAEAKPAKKAAKKAAKTDEDAGPFGTAGEPGWYSISLEHLAGHRGKYSKLAAAAGFDMLVVAGAEELKWADEGNAAWNAVAPVAEATRSVLLLSDEGPQHDEKSHFGRLHLLDAETFATPRKYSKLRAERAETEAAILKLLETTTADKDSEAAIKPLAAEDAKVKELMKFWKEGREDVREQIIDHLLDGQEQGRFVFANSRKLAPGLPVRNVQVVAIETGDKTAEIRDGLKEEYKAHGKKTEEVPAKGKPKAEPSAVDAAAALWLAGVANPPPPTPSAPSSSSEPPSPPSPPPRILVLCASRNRAAAVEKALRGKVQGRVELLTGEERFEIEDIPRVVVGCMADAVGRSFPGIEVVALWDTPLSFEEAQAPVFLMENACTTGSFRVLVPVVADTPQEMVARWLHEGLHAFTEASGVQTAVRDEYQKPVFDLAKKIGAKHNPALHDELAAIIKKSAAAHESAVKKLDKHRDLFLEKVSCRIPGANQAHHRISATDDDESLDMQNNRTLEQCGILVETKGPRMVFVRPNPETSLRLEDVPKDGMTLTYSRFHAAIREDAHFLTWDSPLVSAASERMLSTAVGNTAYVVWEDERAQLLLLEGIYLAVPQQGEPWLHVSRHMPATPVRVVISHEFEDMSGEYTSEVVNKMVRNGRREWIRNNARPLQHLIPNMLRNLTGRAEQKMRELSAKATHQMETSLTADIARMKRLPASKLRAAEIKRLEEQIAALKPLLGEPQLKLDQLRLIRRGPSGKGI